MSAVSGKTTHLIVGEDPGESKTAKSTKLDTKIISKDDFLELIASRRRPIYP